MQGIGHYMKEVTEPYWRVAGDNNINPVQLGNYYVRLVEMLSTIIETPTLLLSNHISFLPGPEQDLNSQSLVLFQPFRHDQYVEIYLKRFCQAIKTKCLTLFKDFLPGGKFFSPTEKLHAEASTCSGNNICLERLMAKTDSSLKNKPNSNISNIESTIMYSNNKVDKWLQERSESSKQEVILSAVSKKKQAMENNKTSKSMLYQQRLAILEKKKELKEQRDIRKQNQREKLDKLMKDNGLFTTEREITKELDNLKTKKEKLSLLKNQITIYKSKEIVKLDTD